MCVCCFIVCCELQRGENGACDWIMQGIFWNLAKYIFVFLSFSLDIGMKCGVLACIEGSKLRANASFVPVWKKFGINENVF